MARAVAKVPNPWESYMDGQIWELTAQEFNALPAWRQLYDSISGAPIGKGMYTWFINDLHYVRFFDFDNKGSNKNDPSVLAGWQQANY